MGTLNGLIGRALLEEGYIKKQSNKELDSKMDNRGSQNYTKYARDVNSAGLMGCQAQPWYCTFQFWLEMQELDVEAALQHWSMGRSNYVGYNCFATYNAFKKAGKVGMTPKLGAVVIFDFSHAGQVKLKTRPWNNVSVKGFCYIDYSTEYFPIQLVYL